MHMRPGYPALFCLFTCMLTSQLLLAQNKDLGELHGNFQVEAQYYRQDSLIGAPLVKEKVLSNGFMNLWYTRGNFTAGLRYENYLNVMQGFDSRYKGSGIPFRFASYTNQQLEATAGNFYEQFGSGILLRAYEERGLGYDNAFEGIRVRYQLPRGFYFKGLIARQRTFFTQSPGIVRAADLEVSLNELIPGMDSSDTRISVAGSMVSRYQADEAPLYKLPENVAAGGGRIQVSRKGLNVFAEYGYKMNDPSSVNKQIYRPGQALTLTTTYAAKGFGILLAAKRLDNFDFRSDRSATGIGANINYLPAMTRQHTYNLPATIYPYATQANGEMGFQAEVNFTLPKGSRIGGKYGTEITLHYAGTNGIRKEKAANDTFGYKSPFLGVSNEVYFRDLHAEIHRKFSKHFKATLMYLYWVYNKDVVQGLKGYGTVYANMFVADMSWKINARHNLRMELQGLASRQDNGSWAMGLIEYTYSPHWFIALMDQYNSGNPNPDQRIHYLNATCGYTLNGNRIMLSYGRQRAGIYCVGGVCRNVPASNGLYLSILSSF